MLQEHPRTRLVRVFTRFCMCSALYGRHKTGSAIESAPLPLDIKAPAKVKIPQKVTGTITAMPLNREAKRLIERYEVNATETYYEEVNISKSTLGEELHKMNVRECSTTVEFLCDKQGDAHSISVKSCNITVAGNADSIIEECREKVAEAVTAYVLGKKWLPTITNGECMSTIFEAHIIFNFEENSNEPDRTTDTPC